MAVPTTVADLSTTASSNGPSGSESPNVLDDHHRALCSIVRQVSDAKLNVGAAFSGIAKGDGTGGITEATAANIVAAIGSTAVQNSSKLANTTPTAAGLALLDDVDAAAQRTTLGLSIGTNVQAYDADIPTVAASQAEMEAGIETALRSMSPERVSQAIAALTPNFGFTLGAPVATSGTLIDITGIPSTATQVVVMLSGVSTTASVDIGLQLGDSGGIETTGYNGQTTDFTTPVTWSTKIGIITATAISANDAKITLTKAKSSTNTWKIEVFACLTSGAGTVVGFGSKSLSGSLDRVRLMNATYDAGEMMVSYI